MPKTYLLDQRPIRCPQCGAFSSPHETRCADCGYPIAPPTPAAVDTGPLTRRPVAMPGEHQGETAFPAQANLVLQFLPSGTCVTLVLARPMILGRGQPTSAIEFLDLSDLNALQHGVSRQHCRLERRGETVVVVDLDSTNGTSINSHALLPHRDYVLANGDKLILGTLHVMVSFSLLPSA